MRIILMSEGSGTHQDVNDFKVAVHEWLRLEEDLTEIQKVVREKRKRKAHLDKFISSFMSSQNKEICNIGENQAIVLSTRKTTSALKKEYILRVLIETFKNEDRAKELVQRIYDMREVREKHVIKKTDLD